MSRANHWHRVATTATSAAERAEAIRRYVLALAMEATAAAVKDDGRTLAHHRRMVAWRASWQR